MNRATIIKQMHDIIESQCWSVLDFETTHLPDFKKVKRMKKEGADRADIFGEYPEPVSVAIVDRCGNKVLNTFLKPLTYDTSWSALEVHGITPELTEYAPTFRDVHDVILRWVNAGNCIAYNADFDEGVLQATCWLYGLPMPRNPMVDAMHPYGAFNGEPGKWGSPYKWWKLVDACAAEGLHVDENAHDALADVQMTRSLVEHMSQWENPPVAAMLVGGELNMAAFRLIMKAIKRAMEKGRIIVTNNWQVHAYANRLGATVRAWVNTAHSLEKGMWFFPYSNPKQLQQNMVLSLRPGKDALMVFNAEQLPALEPAEGLSVMEYDEQGMKV